MSAFAAIMLGLVVFVVLSLLLLGLLYPGSGADQLDWRTPRAVADEEASRDNEDLAQMLEAANARRRARGEPELTVEQLLEETGE